MLQQYGVCFVCKKSGNKVTPNLNKDLVKWVEQVTPKSRSSMVRVDHLKECTCDKLSKWEEACALCLSVTRSKAKDKKIRVKAGDVIEFRSMMQSYKSPYEKGTIKSISNLNEHGAVTISVFGTYTVLTFMDRFQLLKTYHIPEKEDCDCLFDIPDECKQFRELNEYVYTLGRITKEELHKTHMLHKSFVDHKATLRETWNRSRRIGEKMLCDKKLPYHISDYDQYYVDRLQDHYNRKDNNQ